MEYAARKRAWLLAIVAQAAVAATPVLTELNPRGAEIGRPFTLTAVGRNIAEVTRVISTLPVSFTPVISPQKAGAMMTPGRSISFTIEPKAGRS